MSREVRSDLETNEEKQLLVLEIEHVESKGEILENQMIEMARKHGQEKSRLESELMRIENELELRKSS